MSIILCFLMQHHLLGKVYHPIYGQCIFNSIISSLEKIEKKYFYDFREWTHDIEQLTGQNISSEFCLNFKKAILSVGFGALLLSAEL